MFPEVVLPGIELLHDHSSGEAGYEKDIACCQGTGTTLNFFRYRRSFPDSFLFLSFKHLRLLKSLYF